jgi:hypothetical protein
VCGDRIVDPPNEECDIGATSDGLIGLDKGTIYDRWNCDGSTCKRLYIYTPCIQEGIGTPFCEKGFCANGATNRLYCYPKSSTCAGPEQAGVECTVEGISGYRGYCTGNAQACIMQCVTNSDCPQNAFCTRDNSMHLSVCNI